MREVHFDAIIPAIVRYASNISPNEKIFYLELTSLTNRYGYCWATNNWFSDYFQVEIRTISTWIYHLRKFNYIKVIYDKNSHRKIYLNDIPPKPTKSAILIEDIPSYYSVVPYEIRRSLYFSSHEKLFYSEIRALCNYEGYCWANNKYFENLYKVSEQTIRRWLKKLELTKVIFINYTKNGKRMIYLSDVKGCRNFIKAKLFTGGGGKKCWGGRKKCYPLPTKINSYPIEFTEKILPISPSNNIIKNNIIKKDINMSLISLNKFNKNCQKMSKLIAGETQIRHGPKSIGELCMKILK